MQRFGPLVVLALLLTGCASSPAVPPARGNIKPPSTRPVPTTLPTVQTEDQHVVFSFCKSLDWYATMSYREAARRFNNPVVVLGHGGTDPVTQKWVIAGDADRGGMLVVEDVAKAMAAKFQDRDVVFFTCNKGHHRIDVARVWYFTEVIWSMPDEDSKKLDEGRSALELFIHRVRSSRENERGVGCQGSIWEAVTQNGTWR